MQQKQESKMSSAKQKDAATLSLLKHSVAGLTAGAVSTAMLYPLDLVKVRYQVHENSPKAYQSLMHAFSSLLRFENTTNAKFRMRNLTNLYQGMSPALYGATVSWGLYFYLYEHAKIMYKDLPPSTSHFISGLQAGALCVPLTNPIWLIKVRMQVQNTNIIRRHVGQEILQTTAKIPYKNVSDAFKRICAEEGFLALYKGAIPALLLTTHGAFKVINSNTLMYIESLNFISSFSSL